MRGVVQTLLADDPVLLWLLNETSGAVFRDLSGSGNHATISGPDLGKTGPGLGALAAPIFDGVGDSANRDQSVGTVTGMPVGGAARSLEIWAKPSGSATYAALAYGSAHNTGEHVNFQVGSSGSASAFSDGVNVANNKGWTTAAPLNVWRHYAMTYAGGVNGAAIFYINGVPDTTTTLNLTTTAIGATGRVRAGVRSDDGRATLYFAGGLALAAIYAKALTPARVRNHYLAGLGALGAERTVQHHRLRRSA